MSYCLLEFAFKIGDELFIEGIQSVDGDDGSGFNSADYGYNFFKVVDTIL